MPRRDDYDRDERRSWRDVDRGKDRSRHTDQNRPEHGSGGHGTKSSYYKAKLDKLMKDKLEKVFADPERDGMAREIQDAVTHAERKDKTAAYLDKYGLPDDFETLMAMSEVKEDEIFAQVMPSVAERWDDQPDSRRKLAVERLQMRLLRVRDKDARAIATELISKR
jgi:hypothetical protein